MTDQSYRLMLRNSFLNGIGFAAAAVVYIAFSVYYTRVFGIVEYGAFSLLLNTMAALIALGAYEGFLINHAPSETKKYYKDFNSRYFLMNILLAISAGVIFSLISGRIFIPLLISVAVSIFLDYRSQSAIAVLVVSSENWKVRAIRAVYQIVLIVAFLCLRLLDVPTDISFAAAISCAALIHYSILQREAARHLEETDKETPDRSEVNPQVLLIAIASNLASVGIMLLDKGVIRVFSVGDAEQLGTYFLYFDLATRGEAFFLLLSVPVTNFLFSAYRSGGLPTQKIILMIALCFAIGLAFFLLGSFIIPLIYDLNGSDLILLSLLFGFYIAARGVRFLTKAVCNASGSHKTLLRANVISLATGLLLLLLVYTIQGPSLSIFGLVAVIGLANMTRIINLLSLLKLPRSHAQEGAGPHA